MTQEYSAAGHVRFMGGASPGGATPKSPPSSTEAPAGGRSQPPQRSQGPQVVQLQFHLLQAAGGGGGEGAAFPAGGPPATFPTGGGASWQAAGSAGAASPGGAPPAPAPPPAAHVGFLLLPQPFPAPPPAAVWQAGAADAGGLSPAGPVQISCPTQSKPMRELWHALALVSGRPNWANRQPSNGELQAHLQDAMPEVYED